MKFKNWDQLDAFLDGWHESQIQGQMIELRQDGFGPEECDEMKGVWERQFMEWKKNAFAEIRRWRDEPKAPTHKLQ